MLFAHKKVSVYEIKINETGSDNRYVRWASFVRAIDEAQNAIYEVHTNTQLKFRYHIGGGCYISVSANIECIDIR